jgi:CubicO group peptidase (beta-lactamase class C family)
MKRFLLVVFLYMSLFSMKAQTGIPVSEMSNCDTNALNFMSTFNIPAMTYAITKDGKLIYSRAFGESNINKTEETQPYNIFRIASLSKPITAIGIMKLVENGTINLSDKVFGSGGLLENHWYFSNINIIDNRVYDITVQHLLEHSAGWNRDLNCFNNPTTPYPYFLPGCDPIAAPLVVTQSLGESNPVREEYLIAYLLKKNLNHAPGTTYAYSNIGYLVLSEIIEEVSGLSYESYMQQEIFNPIGIYDMHIGKNLLADKIEREAEYVGNGYTTKSLYGDGANVPWEYGGASIEAMDGHGGWIATARDLVRLLVAIDGFSTKPDILQPSTITSMTTPSSTASYYAKGWSVNTANNWWHTGALDGTASIFVRSGGGYTWAIILNKRIIDGTSNSFWSQLDNLGWNCISGTTTFPTHDFFETPTINTSNLIASNVTNTATNLSWTNGNGTSRIVVAKEIVEPTGNSNFNVYPLDGNDYGANSQFAYGDDLGDGSFVIYNGTGNAVSLQGLSAGKQYAIRVYEYTKNAINGNNALYLLGNPSEVLVSTEALGLDSLDLASEIKIYPNPTNNKFTLQNKGSIILKNAAITDLNGREIQNIILNNTTSEKEISLNGLAKGIYLIKISSVDNITITKKIVKQ